jgi:hypothetical protein
MDKSEEFNQYFIQLVWGLQSTAWIGMGKTINPSTGKETVDLEMARDAIDTLLMLKEKTKGNLAPMESTMIEHCMQDLEINFIDVMKKEGEKKKDSNKEEEGSIEKESEDKKEE